MGRSCEKQIPPKSNHYVLLLLVLTETFNDRKSENSVDLTIAMSRLGFCLLRIPLCLSASGYVQSTAETPMMSTHSTKAALHVNYFRLNAALL
ncbi:unnamed protein product [Caenorhabditis nigoni]